MPAWSMMVPGAAAAGTCINDCISGNAAAVKVLALASFNRVPGLAPVHARLALVKGTSFKVSKRESATLLPSVRFIAEELAPIALTCMTITVIIPIVRIAIAIIASIREAPFWFFNKFNLCIVNTSYSGIEWWSPPVCGGSYLYSGSTQNQLSLI